MGCNNQPLYWRSSWGHSNLKTSSSPLVKTLLSAIYIPTCSDKYVYMDQGGELFNNPEIKNLFTKSGYRIYPTGADASNQNGSVGRGHCTIADTVQALLTGSGIDTKFWPYAFYHALRLYNAIPTRRSDVSPLTQATNIIEDFTNLLTFGCRVWVRPPGKNIYNIIFILSE